VCKDESKIQTPPRKSSASAPSDDSDRVVNKHSSPIRRTSGVLSNPNVTNLVKVASNNKKITDANTSWTALPPSLAKLGKVRQDSLFVIQLSTYVAVNSIL
jgi:hypothetical protein